MKGYLWDGSVATAAIKGSPGELISVALYNSGSTLLYVGVYDDANGASANDVPEMQVPLPGGGSVVLDESYFGGSPYALQTGITIGISSDATKYTAHGTPSEITGGVTYL